MSRTPLAWKVLKDWYGRPARRLAHLRYEGFTERGVDSFVFRVVLQNAAITLLVAGVFGSLILGVASVASRVAMLLWVIYAAAITVNVGVSLFAAALHLLVITPQYWRLRRDREQLEEFGSYPLKLAAIIVGLLEQAVLIGYLVVLFGPIWTA